MRIARLFRTSAFRLALFYTALFSASVIVLLGFVYGATVTLIERQTRDTIEAEIRGLAEQYRQEGLQRLINVLRERSGAGGDRNSVYLLTDPLGRPLAGNLESWPRGVAEEGGWLKLQLTRSGEEAVPVLHEVTAREFQLPGGFRLMVGRDTQERARFGAIMAETLIWALAATLLLGLAGGYLLSRRLLRRVEAAAASGRRIVRGELTERLPRDLSGDEFDRLAASVNEMLDQIENLMIGMRTVTDSLAHDLRSPLTRAKSAIELALRDADNPAAQRQALEQTQGEIDAILATFNALVAIARTEAGLTRGEMTEIDLAELARHLAEIYQPLAEDQGLAFTVEATGRAMMVGHRQLLAQAVANLLDNAVKYTPSGGRVAISVREAAGGIELHVADNGPGIPAADRTRVLERFVRLDESRGTGGSGLGLSLVAAVARLHSAMLTLEDNGPGLQVRMLFPPASSAAPR